MTKKQPERDGKRGRQEPAAREPFSPLPWLDALGDLAIRPRAAFDWIGKDRDWRLPATMMGTAVVLMNLQSLVPMVVPIREGVFLSEQVKTVAQSFQNVVLSGLTMGAIFVGAGWLLKTGLFWALSYLLGTLLDFRRLLAGIGLAWLPQYLRYLLLTFAMHAQNESLVQLLSVAGPRVPASWGIAGLVLAQLDVFSLLSLFLCVGACAAYGNLAPRRQWLLGALFWVISSAGQVAFQLFAMGPASAGGM
jgi:hypothetical protein